jgi:hypothetical protein
MCKRHSQSLILESIITGFRFLARIHGLGGCQYFWVVKDLQETVSYGQKEPLLNDPKVFVVFCDFSYFCYISNFVL